MTGFLLSGCNKFHEVPPHTPDCQIVKLKGGIFIGDSLVIAYSHNGNPLSITRASVGTGSPNFLFRYDQKGRMTDYYGVYESPNPFFEVWHRYHYDAKNRITVDTSYSFGFIGPGIPLPDPQQGHLFVGNISTYAYDIENRIIKSTDTYGSASVALTSLYTYNNEGNLVKITNQTASGTNTVTFSFDNKINLRRTHPIWQFLDRDYSINNSVQVFSYNNYGLPVEVNFGSHGLGTFASIPISTTTITYNCKHNF
ncbi:hypothetical protein GCM10022209_30600 [Chitinophaga oryziterrae]